MEESKVENRVETVKMRKGGLPDDPAVAEFAPVSSLLELAACEFSDPDFSALDCRDCCEQETTRIKVTATTAVDVNEPA